MRLRNLLLGLALCLNSGQVAAETVQPVSALAMQGTPRFAEGMTSFDYVNPDAPKGGTLRLGVTGSFDSLNPFIVRGQAPLGLPTGFMSLVYESLMVRNWDEPFTLYGLVAATVEVPEDRSSLIFNLRPEARWQDGQPLTADDVLYSFTTLRDQGRPNHRTYYKKVALAEKLGPHRVRFVFKKNPDGSIDREMPLIMGLMPLLPQHVWAGQIFNQTTLRPPVGSGPYKITKVEAGRSITFERDPLYWGRALPVQRGLYNFDKVRIDYYRDDAVALQAFKAGQYDLRRENDPQKWALAYESPALHDGRVTLARFAHHRTEAINGFVFNLRRPLFQDPALRVALSAAFDFGWMNKTLFRGLYRRTASFFPNAELACDVTQPPQGEERAILETLAARFPQEVPPALLTEPVAFSNTDGTSGSRRAALLSASETLRKAGYRLTDGQLIAPSGEAVVFEILLSDPIEEKIALQWARDLTQLGVKASVRTVDSAQFQARLAAFDYDVTITKWTNSLSPGNEQSAFWSRAAASQQGSRNYPGLQNEAVETLARQIPTARSRETLVATVRAFDRLLMAQHMVIPFTHLGADQIAFRSTLAHPAKMPLYGPVIEAWWATAADEATSR